MRVIIQRSFLLLLLLSCTESDGLFMTPNSTLAIEDSDTKDAIILKAAHVVPTKNQYEAMKNEYIAFIHFGPNSFTRMEWGDGKEDPKIFDLHTLDTDQWCEAMKSSGMKMAIITAKHHDGFVLWQSRYTKHGIMSSPYKDGKGDVLKELAASCQKYGLKLGVYLSPADLYQIEHPQGLYGNLSKETERTIPRAVDGRPFDNKTTFTFQVDDYNEYFLNQLFELLTEYGPIHEVWFDGAHPKRKGGQQYRYGAWRKLIRQLAPEAVIFGKEDIRWCGNESGGTRDTEWNVVPYQEDPRSMNSYADLTQDSLGNRAQLYKGKYLHYQPAETNTSIREGWFYRDDTDQKVRSADDVFDIYERAVGGNSIFLLNIPPNREGKFSPTDVKVLKEVGQRIQKTYGKNLLTGASGPRNILDEEMGSYELFTAQNNVAEITTAQPITINRFVIQEAIVTHSERVEAFVLEAWIDNAWREIAQASNIGYKRILRFPELSSDKFRIRITKSRQDAAIAHVSAHYFDTQAPLLSFDRDVSGLLTIFPKQHLFRWKPHGENAAANINQGMEIRYTLDGSEPNLQSEMYAEPFEFFSGEIKACAVQGDSIGPVSSRIFGILKKDWKLIGTDSQAGPHKGEHAFDEQIETYWRSGSKGTHVLAIDLGSVHRLKGFAYSPQLDHSEGMIQKGIIQMSNNGKSWDTIESFTFGNLINDPSPRRLMFQDAISTRYIRIEVIEIAGESRSAAIAEIDLF